MDSDMNSCSVEAPEAPEIPPPKRAARPLRTLSSSGGRNIVQLFDSLKTLPFSRQAQRQHQLLGSSSLAKRLQLQHTLTGHRGCVNTVAWDSTGTWLVTGSDDRSLNVYMPLEQQTPIYKIPSGHLQNIFSAKFMGNNNARKIVSCGADCQTRITDVDQFIQKSALDEWVPGPSFNCHTEMVFEVLPDVVDSNVFYDCGEDGHLNRYDLRISNSCDCDLDDECLKHSIININAGRAERRIGRRFRFLDAFLPSDRLGISSITQDFQKPYYLAASCSDDTVRIYDTRYLTDDHRESQVYCYTPYAPPGYIFTKDTLARKGTDPERRSSSTKITSLKYCPERSGQLLVSYSKGDCFLIEPSQFETQAQHLERQTAMTADKDLDMRKGKLAEGDTRKNAKGKAKSMDDGPGMMTRSRSKAENDTTAATDGEPTKKMYGSDYEIDMDDNVFPLQETASATVKPATATTPATSNVAPVSSPSSSRSSSAAGPKTALTVVQTTEMKLDGNSEELPPLEHGSPDPLAMRAALEKRRLKLRRATDNYWARRGFKAAIRDTNQVYTGHKNSATMIKEAAFYGPHSEFITSGSDDGRVFIWDRKTAKLVNVVVGDKSVVNCIQVQPTSKVYLAVSGIDWTAKIFAPTAENRVDLRTIKGIRKKSAPSRSFNPILGRSISESSSELCEDQNSNEAPEDNLDPERAYLPLDLNTDDDDDDDDDYDTDEDDDDPRLLRHLRFSGDWTMVSDDDDDDDDEDVDEEEDVYDDDPMEEFLDEEESDYLRQQFFAELAAAEAAEAAAAIQEAGENEEEEEEEDIIVP